MLAKEASYGQVLIEFIPRDADAVSHETPLGALFGGGGEQAREPHERGTEFTAIRKDDAESLVIGGYVNSACIKLND
jgi:hypothetical protein